MNGVIGVTRFRLIVIGLVVLVMGTERDQTGSSRPRDIAATIRIVHVDPFHSLAQMTHAGLWQAVVVDRIEDPSGVLPKKLKLAISFFSDSHVAKRTSEGGYVLDDALFVADSEWLVRLPLGEARRCPAPSLTVRGKKIYSDDKTADRYDGLPCFDVSSEDLWPVGKVHE